MAHRSLFLTVLSEGLFVEKCPTNADGKWVWALLDLTDA